MKNTTFRLLPLLLMATLLLVSTSVNAQSRTGRRHAQTTKTTISARLKAPAAPTPVSVRERTIQDLLFFPFASLPDNLDTREKAQEQLTATFGQCEFISLYPGLHAHDTFDFTYRDVPLGLAYYDWSDNRCGIPSISRPRPMQSGSIVTCAMTLRMLASPSLTTKSMVACPTAPVRSPSSCGCMSTCPKR